MIRRNETPKGHEFTQAEGLNQFTYVAGVPDFAVYVQKKFILLGKLSKSLKQHIEAAIPINETGDNQAILPLSAWSPGPPIRNSRLKRLGKRQGRVSNQPAVSLPQLLVRLPGMHNHSKRILQC